MTEAKKLFDLTGRVAIVTGAGSGLGKDACTGYVESGANVALLDVNIAAAEEAQLVIAVFDLSRPWDAEDEAVLAIAEKAAVRIAAANKSDCAPRWDVSRLSAHFDSVCVVSAKEKTGLDALGAAVAAAFPMPEADSGEILTNARQADAVRRALEYLRAAREAMAAGFAPDAVLTECEGAMDALGALSGRSVREDVTQEIFSRFCVGK